MKLKHLPHIFLYIATLLLSGCSATEGPDNLEPVLYLLDATDITRTEAVISAQIECRGTGKLSFLRFYYGEGEGINMQEEIPMPVEGVVSVQLTNLNPGTSYTYYAEGGNGTATLSTRKLTFTTRPTDMPSLSRVRILASGPVGIYVEFEVTEDGGIPLTGIGCEVTEIVNGSIVRHPYTEDSYGMGIYGMYILGLSPYTDYIITPYASNAAGESIGEPLSFTTPNGITLTQPGTLSKFFSNDSLEIEEITISGVMNGDDFHFLRHLLGAPLQLGEDEIISRLSSVNLANVDIVEGGGPYDGGHYIVADVVSSGLFADCPGLKNIVMPISATEIMRDAFKNCCQLASLTIPPNVTSLLPSTGCVALEEIEVSAGNRSYKSIEGVLFNSDATEIVWFPLGKSGEYTLPSTITSIGENAFIETHITSLIIPSSVVSIARGAFVGSSLEEITLPDKMTNVSEGMFQNCASLKTARLGEATEFLGNYIFDSCEIEDLYVAAEFPPYLSADSFFNREYDIYEHCTLHVPEGSKSMYTNHYGWNKFRNIVVF